MTPLPKRRLSTRRKGKRRLNICLGLKNLAACPKCGAKKLPNRKCRSCGN